MVKYITRFAYNDKKTYYMQQIGTIDVMLASAKTDIGKHVLIQEKSFWQERLRQLDTMVIVETSEQWLEKTQEQYK